MMERDATDAANGVFIGKGNRWGFKNRPVFYGGRLIWRWALRKSEQRRTGRWRAGGGEGLLDPLARKHRRHRS